MPDFKLSLTAKPPKPKAKKLGPRVVVHAGGRGGSGNIRRTKESATQPSSNSLTQVKSNSTTATAATAATAATSRSRTTSGSNRTGSSVKSLSSSQNEHPDYGCSIISPAGREVGLPRNKTTRSGRGGLGNAHDHVLENGIFERVLAYEEAVTRSHQELKTTRRTGRGGAGNIKGSKRDKYGSPSKRSFLTESLKSRSASTKSSDSTSYRLARIETQTSVQTTDTNGVPLSTSSRSDQIPETLQEERGTYNNKEEVEEPEVDLGGIVTKVARIPTWSQRNFSRPTQSDVVEAKISSSPRRSPFRPSPESWANATTEALAHLKATGVISQVPEVPRYAQTLSPGITSPSPNASRATENDIEISAESHFKRVAPGVSLYSPSPSEQTGLIPPSPQFQSQQSSKLVRTPSDGSTEIPYRRTREKRQTYLGKDVANYSPTLSPDYSAKHEESDEQKPARSRAPSRPYWAEDSPCHSLSGHTDDPPRYAAQSPPIPAHSSHLSATQTHEKQGSLTSDETVLNLACYAFPLVPEPRLVHMLPALRHSPQDRRREGLVSSVGRDVQQSSWGCERRRDNYPLNPPPYGTTQSPGREPIDHGSLYRSQRHRAERAFPASLRDDRISSSPAPVPSPPIVVPYRSQDSRASPAPRGRLGEHRSFLGAMSPESRPVSPKIDPTRLQNYRGGASTDRRLTAITKDVPQGCQPSSAGHSSGSDRGSAAEYVSYRHLRRARSKHRDLSLREIPIPSQPLPPTPSSHHPDEHDSLYHSSSEPRHGIAFEDRYSPNYSSHPSSIATVATQYDGIFAAASTVRSLSQPSTIDDPQDELHDRIVNSVSARTHRAKEDRAFFSDAPGEYQYEEGGTSDQDLKVRGRGTVEALQSACPGRTVSNYPPNLTNTTAVSKEVNPTRVPQKVVVPFIRPAGSLRMPNAEDEAPLHVDELHIPPRKPLSRMEKALLRRVEFGSNIDHTKVWIT